ncbi:hypothetical protein HDC37_003076 [Microbacterium sp. AK009]|uniref:hypothetical protein n=1 Tax=Microbacterium sp. AK009 TaxID=2723068 RepID=UPI0015C8B6D8|nr:hypothetical protein [Microbacterium sp. AK009]NYF18220.1 hypothetical protein [Microbacterium sp. AK009]
MQDRSRRIALSPHFAAWAEDRDYLVYYFPDEDQVAVASHPGGEYQFRITHRDGLFFVKPVTRSRGGDVMFRSADLLDVERFLTAAIENHS